MNFLSVPTVPVQQLASEEGSVGITEVELVAGSVQSVTVYGARPGGVPSGVANMSVRAGIAYAEPGRLHPHLSCLISNHVPVFIWGLREDVNKLVASVEGLMIGSRLVSVFLFLRPHLAGPGHGLRFRELSVTIIGAEGSMEPQVFLL